MTDQPNHPTSGRRRRHKSPAAVSHVHDLPLPSLLNHMGADEDGPSCSEEEKEAKRLRSASTAPSSERGTHPSDCDQVVGITPVGSRESVRFGEENDPEMEDIPDGDVRNAVDVDETLDNDLYHDADPGVGETQGGYGSASLTECLGRLGVRTTSATCHFGEGLRDTRSFPTDPSQVMSPNLGHPSSGFSINA